MNDNYQRHHAKGSYQTGSARLHCRSTTLTLQGPMSLGRNYRYERTPIRRKLNDRKYIRWRLFLAYSLLLPLCTKHQTGGTCRKTREWSVGAPSVDHCGGSMAGPSVRAEIRRHVGPCRRATRRLDCRPLGGPLTHSPERVTHALRPAECAPGPRSCAEEGVPFSGVPPPIGSRVLERLRAEVPVPEVSWGKGTPTTVQGRAHQGVCCRPLRTALRRTFARWRAPHVRPRSDRSAFSACVMSARKVIG